MFDPTETFEASVERSHRFVASRTALLVIDMQHGFLDEGASLEVPAGRKVVPSIRRLIDVCRGRIVPVIFTEFVYASYIPCLRGVPFGVEHTPATPGEATGLGKPSGNCRIGPDPASGVESASTIEALAPQPGELVVRAHTYDKFYGTPLDLALRSQDIRFLLVAGVTTDVCVNSTVISATTRDYRVTVISDAVASPWPDLHAACLSIWRNKFARLKTTDEAVAELEQT